MINVGSAMCSSRWAIPLTHVTRVGRGKSLAPIERCGNTTTIKRQRPPRAIFVQINTGTFGSTEYDADSSAVGSVSAYSLFHGTVRVF
mmetsp:Transcript_34822/g.83275  ORF Transcript_34822/g.83275 Transcript_34822/m.83275 type:complete len:88 (-) Transcript_34822:99-362(-)